MKEQVLTYLIIAAAFLLILLYASKRCSWKCDTYLGGNNEQFTISDQQAGKAALDELEKMLSSGQLPPEVSDEELDCYSEDIYIVKLPAEDTKEDMSYFHAENTRYWPYYYYSFPYNYKYGGAWPPGYVQPSVLLVTRVLHRKRVELLHASGYGLQVLATKQVDS